MAPVTARRPWLAADAGRRPGGVPGRALLRAPRITVPHLPDAACAVQPVNMFPDTGKALAAALAVCATCPLRTRTACLEGAQARRERFGVWGGVDFEASEREHRRSPRDGKLPRGAQAMERAGRLRELRGEHSTLRELAAAAGLSTETVRFYLTLLDLDPASQERVRSGEIAAYAAVREARRSPKRAS